MAQAGHEVITASSAAAVAEGMRQVSPDLLIACPAGCRSAIEGTFSSAPSAGLVRHYTTVDSSEAAIAESTLAAGEGRRVLLVTSAGRAAENLGRLACRRHLPVVIVALACAPADSAAAPSDPAQSDACVQFHTDMPQEAYDSLIQAVRIAEHPELMAPVIVVARGDAVTPMAYNGGGAVRAFVGLPPPAPRPSPEPNPELALALVRAFGDAYGHRFGRHYAILDIDRMAGAELAVVALGTAATAVRPILHRLRSEGVRIGMVRPRVARPFPAHELAGALRQARAVAVLTPSPGPTSTEAEVSLYEEVAAALQAQPHRPALSSHTYGPQGEGLARDDIERLVAGLQEAGRP